MENRILTSEEYQHLWIERCERSYNLLTQTTDEDRELMQNKVPELFLYGASESLSEIYFENFVGELFVYKDEMVFCESK